jgi:hypothetical protein
MLNGIGILILGSSVEAAFTLASPEAVFVSLLQAINMLTTNTRRGFCFIVCWFGLKSNIQERQYGFRKKGSGDLIESGE